MRDLPIRLRCCAWLFGTRRLESEGEFFVQLSIQSNTAEEASLLWGEHGYAGNRSALWLRAELQRRTFLMPLVSCNNRGGTTHLAGLDSLAILQAAQCSVRWSTDDPQPAGKGGRRLHRTPCAKLRQMERENVTRCDRNHHSTSRFNFILRNVSSSSFSQRSSER